MPFKDVSALRKGEKAEIERFFLHAIAGTEKKLRYLGWRAEGRGIRDQARRGASPSRWALNRSDRGVQFPEQSAGARLDAQRQHKGIPA
jgi:hypothetical protein